MLKKLLFLSVAITYLTINVHAQHKHICGNTIADNEYIKEQMLLNKRLVSDATLDFMQNQRNTIYVPVTIHLIADANGDNAPNVESAINTICNLNEDYGYLGIQFFLSTHMPIKYIKNNWLYNDNHAYLGDYAMKASKEYGVLNLFIGEFNSYSISGMYSIPYDFVYIIKQETFIGAMAASHEVGHYFTLAHTFSGWESTDYHTYFSGQNAPSMLGGVAVEYKTRTGINANCATAGDGFCDTEADYYSDRTMCDQNMPIALDPLGEVLTPNTNNYMSYFYDVCMNTFSNQQARAIYASIASRTWLNAPVPNNHSLEDNFTPLLSPSINQAIDYNYNNPFYFTWKATNHALGYIFQLEYINNNTGQIDTLENKWVWNNNLFLTTHSSNKITRAGHYRWSIISVNAHSCLNNNANIYYDFYINNEELITAIDEVNQYKLQEHNITVFSNPIQQGNEIVANISSTYNCNAQVSLYSIDGRLISKQQIDLMADTENIIQFNSINLAKGMHILQVKSNIYTTKSKFLIH